MTCDETARSLSAFLDEELPAEARDRVARHLEECPHCRRMRMELADVSLLVRAAPQASLPEGLESAVRGALHARLRTRQAATRRRVAVFVAPLLSAAAAAAITAIVLGGPGAGDRAPRDPLADVLAAHVRSLLDAQPTQVASEDPHTVRPWFAGRLDFAPATPDLGAQGYPLIGGRLDYVDQRLVAALVYRRRQHVINVFAAPEGGSGPPSDLPASLRHGYNVVGWQGAGLTYTAISDLNATELEAFRTLFEESQPQRR